VGCWFPSQSWKSPVSTVRVICVVWIADRSGSESMKKQTSCPTVRIKFQQLGRSACTFLK
jgi:hypothetical protein